MSVRELQRHQLRTLIVMSLARSTATSLATDETSAGNPTAMATTIDVKHPENFDLAYQHREVLPELVAPVALYRWRLVQCRGGAVERILGPAEVVPHTP